MIYNEKYYNYGPNGTAGKAIQKKSAWAMSSIPSVTLPKVCRDYNSASSILSSSHPATPSTKSRAGNWPN